MGNFENRFGKFAIKNLTLYLITGYLAGYIIMICDQVTGTNMLNLLTLDPAKIVAKGQVWRLLSWVLIPPFSYNGFSGLLFMALMMYCCFSIGTVLERTWGTLKYNMFILGGMLITIVSSFISFVILYFMLCTGTDITLWDFCQMLALGNSFEAWTYFSTYYINMSIYILFALTYPDNMVRFMFFIPVKMKWLGIIDGAYFAYDIVRAIIAIVGGNQIGVMLLCAVLAAVVNIFIFWLINIKSRRGRVRRATRLYGTNGPSGNSAYTRAYANAASSRRDKSMRPSGITRHKCAVCGQTDESNPDLEFRFCSKCNGAYEYCQNHLFTHTHKV